jgi:DNA invertase Pin-like site-specific DNA recombinase
VTDTLGYCRVSTEQQATDLKTSLADQRRVIIDHARSLGRVLDPQHIFEDAGYSGATAEGRPAFMAMLRYCEKNVRPPNRPGAIVILNDSRFGRFDTIEEAMHHRFVFRNLGWPIRFAEADNIDDPLASSLVRVVQSAEASTYRANLRKRAKGAARSHALLGEWQQEAPYGYRRLATRADGVQRVLSIGQRKAEDEVSRLTPGPEREQNTVRFLFEEYASGGLGIEKLGQMMAARDPAKRWSKQVVRQVLHNPAYMGDVVWCRRVTDKRERLERKVREESEWVVVRDAHPALVTRELWQRVQARMASNKRETTATVGGYPLAGIVRCSACGNHFAGGGGPKGPPEDPDRYRFYKDTGNTKRVPECAPPMLTLRKRWLEDTVIDAVAQFVAKPSTQDTIRREMSLLVRQSKNTTASERTEIEHDRTLLLKQRTRLVDAIGQGTLTEGEAATSLAEVRSRLVAVEARIEQLRFASRATVAMGQEIDLYVAIARNFPATVRRLSGAALRETLLPWIAYARVNKAERVLELGLWKVPAADKVFRFGDMPALATQDNTLLKRLTARRRIKLPASPGQFLTWYNRNRPRVTA